MLRPVLFFAFLASSASAGTIYVNGGLATGANNGTSWIDAYRGSDAVVVAVNASVAGDEIWVAAGTYTPTTTSARTISHRLKDDVSIYGGFSGTETSLAQRDHVANVTILSGDIGVSGNVADNSHHVVDAFGSHWTAVLDGFRVTGGNADVSDGVNDRGAGILCSSGASPSIRNCHFLANHSAFGGGAGYCYISNPTFTDTVFENNVGGHFGGAVAVYFAGPTWNRCKFFGNTAGRGGALQALGSGYVRIASCLFHQNAATDSGGGGAIWTDSVNAMIWNCTIVENSSSAHAAGGIYLGIGSSVANCIAWDNSGPGGAQANLNQIFGSPSVQYSIVEGGHAGMGNLGLAPQFTNPGANDFTLTIASPAVDAGNNVAAFAELAFFSLDLAGHARFADEPTVADTGAGTVPIVDIGAYEFPAPAVTAFCFGDGSGAACPCGNDAPFLSGTGCLNSLSTGGLLASTGSARILGDTFVLQGSGMTNSSCLYFQGTTQLNGGLGNVFGDGLRCAGGSVVRLGTKVSAGGASQYPGAGDPTISVKGLVVAAGSVRTYQCWYRNAAAFCAPETFNLTSALQVTWEL